MSEVLSKLRGFLEINGEELPTQEQWEKIVDLIKEKTSDKSVSSRPRDSYKLGLEYEPILCKASDEDWQLGDDGNLTFVGDVKLSNSYDVDDIINLGHTTDIPVDSKLLGIDSVSIEFESQDEAQDDRSDRSG